MGFAMYLLKANLILSVLFGAYWLLLRNERFFQLNRFILLSILVSAFLLPLLPQWQSSTPSSTLVARVQEQIAIVSPFAPVTATAIKPTPTSSATSSAAVVGENTPPVSSTKIEPTISFSVIVLGLYLMVAAILFCSFLFQLLKLYAIQYERDHIKEDGYTQVHHDRDIPPFSFFKLLVINPNTFDHAKFQQVIAHEKVHIRQRHTLDILLSEIATMFCWFNPIIWLFKRYVKLNLEYIADEAVLDTGIDKKAYQYHLLFTSSKAMSYRLSNLFNSSPIKLRIKMMNTNKISSFGILKYTLIVPLLVGLYVFIQPQRVLAQTAVGINSSTQTKSSSSLEEGENVYIKINRDVSEHVLEKMTEELAKKNIFIKINNKNFNDGYLTAIDMDIRVPNRFQHHITMTGKGGDFETVIFTMESGKKESLYFGEGVPNNISAKGRKILTENLIHGMLIIKKDGRITMTGAYNFDE